jgi:hypothetical protein
LHKGSLPDFRSSVSIIFFVQEYKGMIFVVEIVSVENSGVKTRRVAIFLCFRQTIIPLSIAAKAQKEQRRKVFEAVRARRNSYLHVFTKRCS